MSWIILALAMIAGTFAYRLRGGAYFKLPRPAPQILCALPVPIVLLEWPIVALIVFAATAAVMSFGHASHQDMGRGVVPRDGADTEFYSGWVGLTGLDDTKRDLLGLSTKGLLLALPLMLGLMIASLPGPALLSLLAAFSLPAAYWLAWKAYDLDWVREPIAPAEYGSGALLWGVWGALALWGV